MNISGNNYKAINNQNVITAFHWSVIKSQFGIDDVGSPVDQFMCVMQIGAPKNTMASMFELLA